MLVFLFRQERSGIAVVVAISIIESGRQTDSVEMTQQQDHPRPVALPDRFISRFKWTEALGLAHTLHISIDLFQKAGPGISDFSGDLWSPCLAHLLSTEFCAGKHWTGRVRRAVRGLQERTKGSYTNQNFFLIASFVQEALADCQVDTVLARAAVLSGSSFPSSAHFENCL